MKRVILTALLLGPALSATESPTPSTASVTIRLADRGNAIPDTLHGIFLEEINNAFDGGLYAELIQNRSFEEGVLPPGMKLVKQADGSLKMELEKLPPGVPEEKWPMPWPWGTNCVWNPERELLAWSLDKRGGASGEMKITDANPMNAASSRSLAMKVDASSPGSAVALANSGYWGIHIQSGTSYDLKFYLLPTAFDGTLTATLESKDGKILGKQEFGKITPGKAWRRHTAQITATGSDPQARLVLSFSGKGSLQIDWVSLFPPTYKNRPNGLRPELAKYLEDLKPSFVRYPGGCYVEGLSWESAPDWRKMVCPPEDRPGQWGYWQYRSTDGFGYHEFLQFCEDIGADAMYVAFCGMTVHPENNMPLDQIGPVIQQTLDAIEYATGPVTSKWGAVRAKMGHPKPFPLKYVEIGNEHPPAIYGDYYVKFREAIKAKYPDITVIMSMFWSGLNPAAIARAGDANIDMIDEHAYRDASWIRTNFNYFDKYPRKPWTIYVGEYASHHGAGDWYGGMGDSLYLMMCERNGDLVKMASYAPLFRNIHKNDWAINLIEFDSSRSFAHASYYMQKMFAENRPDVNLGTSFEVSPKPDPAEPLLGGGFGLGSTGSQVEFKDLKITDGQGQVIAADNFQSTATWETVAGTWQAEGGVLKQTDDKVAAAVILMKNFELRTGKVTLKARRTGGNDAFNLIFSRKGGDHFLYSNCGSGGNKWCDILQRGERDGQMFQKLLFTENGLENGRWYDVTLDVGLAKAELFLDGKKVAESSVFHPQSLFANAGYDGKTKTVIVKATNYYKTPLTTEVTLDGVANVAPSGKHFFMTSSQPYAENSFEKPHLIVPQEAELKGCAPRFTVTLPPHSVNILSIPATRK